MKIVFTNDTIYGWASGISVVGGAERQQWLLARALAAIGWSVTVGVRKTLEAGERRTIDGVEFLGMGQGQYSPGMVSISVVRATRLVVLAMRGPPVGMCCRDREACWSAHDICRGIRY